MTQPPRRLVICCDGTWNTRRNKDGTTPAPTNVLKFRASVAERDAVGTEQLAFYREGVGTRGTGLDRALGGIFGYGLRQDLQSAFKWLAETWGEGDTLFIVGFSRGAYVARSLAGMIAKVGVPDLRGEMEDADKWALVKYAEALYRRPKRAALEHKPDYDAVVRQGPRVAFLGVWDTVGALGVPEDYALLNLFMDDPGKHKFHDTELGQSIDCARHAVAIDEQRVDFVPTLWSNIDAEGVTKDVQQVWFPGVHGDLGGSYAARGLGDVSLEWMMQAAQEKGLAFRKTAFADLQPDPRGVVHDSMTGVFAHRRTRPRALPSMWGESLGSTDLSDAAVARVAAPGIGEAQYWPTVRLVPGDTAVVVVPSDRHWVSTGVYMGEGETYRFEAKGEWMDASLRAGPEGVYPQFKLAMLAYGPMRLVEGVRWVYRKLSGNPRAETLLLRLGRRRPGAPWFGLIGTVANGRGVDPDTKLMCPHQDMYLGADSTHAVTGSGYFYAYANDAWGFYRNNRGRLRLTITRVD